jgi:hypothetical protein
MAYLVGDPESADAGETSTSTEAGRDHQLMTDGKKILMKDA